jgi:hypothetical protein
VAALQPGAVDRRQRHAAPAGLAPRRQGEYRVEHLAGRLGAEQPGGGLLEGRVVRDGLQPDRLAQGRGVLQVGR